LEERNYTKGLLEALLFLSSDPIKLSALAKSCGIEKTEARELLDELILDYQEREGGFLLREIAGGYQFITNQKYSEILSHIFKDKKRETLSRGTLDTLAIIAYKQPITLTELDEIRGVSSRAMVASLMSKKLVKAVGQKEVPGRPTLYGTTNEFLLHFGLSKLTDLPTPVEVKELKFEDFSPDSIIVTDETEMNPDFDLDSLPEELKEEKINE
jgi:segregation and condensation protein B